jgi:hypothetical protein
MEPVVARGLAKRPAERYPGRLRPDRDRGRQGKGLGGQQQDTALSSIDQNLDRDDGYRVATYHLGFRPSAIAVDEQAELVWVTVA